MSISHFSIIRAYPLSAFSRDPLVFYYDFMVLNIQSDLALCIHIEYIGFRE